MDGILGYVFHVIMLLMTGGSTSEPNIGDIAEITDSMGCALGSCIYLGIYDVYWRNCKWLIGCDSTMVIHGPGHINLSPK
jgi:hypothetical protein